MKLYRSITNNNILDNFSNINIKIIEYGILDDNINTNDFNLDNYEKNVENTSINSDIPSNVYILSTIPKIMPILIPNNKLSFEFYDISNNEIKFYVTKHNTLIRSFNSDFKYGTFIKSLEINLDENKLILENPIDNYKYEISQYYLSKDVINFFIKEIKKLSKNIKYSHIKIIQNKKIIYENNKQDFNIYYEYYEYRINKFYELLLVKNIYLTDAIEIMNFLQKLKKINSEVTIFNQDSFVYDYTNKYINLKLRMFIKKVIINNDKLLIDVNYVQNNNINQELLNRYQDIIKRYKYGDLKKLALIIKEKEKIRIIAEEKKIKYQRLQNIERQYLKNTSSQQSMSSQQNTSSQQSMSSQQKKEKEEKEEKKKKENEQKKIKEKEKEKQEKEKEKQENNYYILIIPIIIVIIAILVYYFVKRNNLTDTSIE